MRHTKTQGHVSNSFTGSVIPPHQHFCIRRPVASPCTLATLHCSHGLRCPWLGSDLYHICRPGAASTRCSGARAHVGCPCNPSALRSMRLQPQDKCWRHGKDPATTDLRLDGGGRCAGRNGCRRTDLLGHPDWTCARAAPRRLPLGHGQQECAANAPSH